MTAEGLGFDREAERFRLMLGVLLVLLVGGLLLVWHQNLLNDPDTWWHIKLGSDIWTKGEFPTVDTYSHTFYGQPFIAKEWLSQIIWFFAYTAGGWNAVVLITIASVCLTTLLVYWGFTAYLKPLTAACLTVVGVFLTSPIFVARPHILTLPIVVIWTVQLFQVADAKAAPKTCLLLLMVLWANLHGGFTVGFIIAGFAALHALQVAGLSDKRLVLRWAVFLLLCPAVSLIHPYTYQPLAINIQMARGYEALPYITEWQPFTARDNKVHEFALIAVFGALLLARLRLSMGKVGLVAFTLHMFLSHVRFCYAFYLVSPLAMAREIASAFPSAGYDNWKSAPRDAVERALGKHSGKGLIVACTSALIVVSVFMNLKDVGPREKLSIESALAFAISQNLKGNVLNSYDFGGPLVYHGIKTFIDGRAEQIFLGGFITNVYQAQELGKEELFGDQLEKYRIEWTLLTKDDPRVTMLDRMPGWKRVYSDEYAVIYTRNRSP